MGTAYLRRVIQEVQSVCLQFIPLQLGGAQPGKGTSLDDLILEVCK